MVSEYLCNNVSSVLPCIYSQCKLYYLFCMYSIRFTSFDLWSVIQCLNWGMGRAICSIDLLTIDTRQIYENFSNVSVIDCLNFTVLQTINLTSKMVKVVDSGECRWFACICCLTDVMQLFSMSWQPMFKTTCTLRVQITLLFVTVYFIKYIFCI